MDPWPAGAEAPNPHRPPVCPPSHRARLRRALQGAGIVSERRRTHRYRTRSSSARSRSAGSSEAHPDRSSTCTTPPSPPSEASITTGVRVCARGDSDGQPYGSAVQRPAEAPSNASAGTEVIGVSGQGRAVASAKTVWDLDRTRPRGRPPIPSRRANDRSPHLCTA